MTLKEAMNYLEVSKAKMSRLAKSVINYEDPRDKRKRWVKRSDIKKFLQLRPRIKMSFDEIDHPHG